MKTYVLVAFGVFTLAIPVAAADSTANGIGVYGSFFAEPAPKTNQNPPVVWNQPAPIAAQEPAVVCGMTIVPARPVDPAMKRSAPDARQFPMRTIEPPICTR